MEDKQFICDCLAHTLKQTDAFKDLIRIDYVKEKNSDESQAIIHYQSGTRFICTTLDDGFAMMKDIINHIGG